MSRHARLERANGIGDSAVPQLEQRPISTPPQRSAPVLEQQHASSSTESATATKCWVLAYDKAGTPCKLDGEKIPCKLYVGEFTDKMSKDEGDLTAHMQRVHSMMTS